MSTNSAAPAAVGQPESTPDAPFTDHEYDGIQEYDNPMPRWWVWSFWGSFYFAVCYVMWNHVYMRGTPVEEEWATDMRTAREESARRELGTISEESLRKLAANGAVMADARATFSKRCVECHGPKGEGVIGPNLTDDYWLHGKASFMDIYGVVKDGVPAKGMPAWGKKLDLVEVAKLAAYVVTIRGQHLEGKAPEGTFLATVAPAAK
jgi:cytochrome c oxidase cbb3-type subunit 3